MCTLSFVPANENLQEFIVTSNRDESPNRETISPKKYSEMGVEMLYPKDKVAGGTWIGASSRKRLVCLINGGFVAHQRGKTYKKSRGVIVKELLSAEKTTDILKDVDLDKIEPFTLVVVDWGSKSALRKLVWDGTKKYLKELPIRPYIWSASMLYSEEIKQKRELIFQKFITENTEKLTKERLLDFHQQFRIDREKVKTTSITQFVHTNESSEMVYRDFQSEK